MDTHPERACYRLLVLGLPDAEAQERTVRHQVQQVSYCDVKQGEVKHEAPYKRHNAKHLPCGSWTSSEKPSGVANVP